MTASEPFCYDCMASHILGMGDVSRHLCRNLKKSNKMHKRCRRGSWRPSLTSMRPSLNLACRGSMGGLVKLIPGMNKVTPQQIHDAKSHNHRLHDELNDSQGMCRFGASCQVSFKKEKCCTWFWKNPRAGLEEPHSGQSKGKIRHSEKEEEQLGISILVHQLRSRGSAVPKGFGAKK
ncbi:unnamed protein product [Sphagnum troendelagicum]